MAETSRLRHGHSGCHVSERSVFLRRIHVSLSLEKALKGIYLETLHAVPPKTHNLLYLLDKIGKKPEERLVKFIAKLNTASVATRYPDNLEKMRALYTKEISAEMIHDSKEVLTWIKTLSST